MALHWACQRRPRRSDRKMTATSYSTKKEDGGYKDQLRTRLGVPPK